MTNGSAPVIHRFDTSGLYAALDTRRIELGLSWSAVAQQIWELTFAYAGRR